MPDNYSPLDGRSDTLDTLLALGEPTPPPAQVVLEANEVSATDRTTVRMVVAFLGVICLAALAAAVWLASQKIDAAVISAVAVAPLTTSLGALAAVLVSTRSAKP